MKKGNTTKNLHRTDEAINRQGQTLKRINGKKMSHTLKGSDSKQYHNVTTILSSVVYIAFLCT